MKSIFKKNQIIIAALAVMICIAGYLNFTREDDVDEGNVLINEADDIYDSADGQIAVPDNALEISAGGEFITASGGAASLSTLELEDDVEKSSAGEAVLASTVINRSYFSEAKLAREQIRAKNKETLMSVIENAEVSDKQKQEALKSVIKITETAELENAAELLLEAKGFDGVVVSIVEDSVDVVVNSASITDGQVAQIEDIITRKTGYTPESIFISPVVAEE